MRSAPPPERPPAARVGRTLMVALVTVAVITLVVLDEDRTFEWLLARALGLSLVFAGYEVFLWAQRRRWWNEFFTAGVAGEAVVVLIQRTFLGYLPVFWPVLWASGPVLSLVFAGGVREATKTWKLPERQAMATAAVGGLVLHYVVVAGLVDAVFVMLTGRYP